MGTFFPNLQVGTQETRTQVSADGETERGLYKLMSWTESERGLYIHLFWNYNVLRLCYAWVVLIRTLNFVTESIRTITKANVQAVRLKDYSSSLPYYSR